MITSKKIKKKSIKLNNLIKKYNKFRSLNGSTKPKLFLAYKFWNQEENTDI